MRWSSLILALLIAVPCMAQEQPWPVTTNDPAFLELTVNEIYSRVRARVDSLVNDYVTTGVLDTDTIRSTAPNGLFLDGSRFYIRDESSASPVQAWLFLYEDPDNGSNWVGIQPPASFGTSWTWILPPDNGDAGEVLQTNGGGTSTWEPTGNWSRTGDTLVQSGWVNVPDEDIRDTITLATAYSSVTSYEVTLAWIQTTTIHPPAGGADTLWVIKGGGTVGDEQYQAGAFIIQVPYAGAKLVGWVASGT